MFSVRGVLCAPLRFDARFAGAVLGLRDALALFEVVLVARDAAFAARPRTLLPRPDLDALAGEGSFTGRHGLGHRLSCRRRLFLS